LQHSNVQLLYRSFSKFNRVCHLRPIA